MIGFQEAEYSIGEEDGPLRVCVDLEGNIERDIALELTTLPMAAEGGCNSPVRPSHLACTLSHYFGYNELRTLVKFTDIEYCDAVYTTSLAVVQC